jgi:hypothetical protein
VAGEPPREYVAGQRMMDGHQIMRKVMDNGETAIVRDLGQTGDNGVKGDYYDAYVDGDLVLSCDTEAEARKAIRDEQRRR